jgi:thiamine-monophosphate kinase
MGSVETGHALRRSGAQAGDIVYVSGTIGDGALGLKLLRGELAGPSCAEASEGGLTDDQAAELIGRYRLPRPRIGLGARLAGLASAAIDISDGLAADLTHILDASGTGAEIEAATVPLSTPAAKALARDAGCMETILTGGDDYELLFTVAPGYAGRVAALASDLALPLTPIGRITAGGGLRVVGVDGEAMRLARKGWTH